MRKMGNKGVHHNTEESVGSIEIRGLLPTIETEIDLWKKFVDEGHESLYEIARQKEYAFQNGIAKKDPKKERIALFVTILGLGAILFFTYRQTVQFFVTGLRYDTRGLLIYLGCIVAFLVLAAYYRQYGKVHRSIYNAFAFYFVAPSIYQIILCLMGKDFLGEIFIYIAFAVVVLGAYSTIAIVSAQQKGGIVGYK